MLVFEENWYSERNYIRNWAECSLLALGMSRRYSNRNMSFTRKSSWFRNKQTTDDNVEQVWRIIRTYLKYCGWPDKLESITRWRTLLTRPTVTINTYCWSITVIIIAKIVIVIWTGKTDCWVLFLLNGYSCFCLLGYVLSSHVVPANPDGHWQAYEDLSEKHCPLFMQGLEAHAFVSTVKSISITHFLPHTVKFQIDWRQAMHFRLHWSTMTSFNC